MKIKYFVFILVALLITGGIIGGVYLNHKVELQRQLQKQQYDAQLQLSKQKEARQLQLELDATANESRRNKLELESRLSGIEDSMRAQEEDLQNQHNCESNGGRYAGGGTCVYY